MLLALTAFVVLLATGMALQELEWPHVVAWVLVVAGVLAVVVALQWSPTVFGGAIALMDAILVIVIFKGDITLR